MSSSYNKFNCFVLDEGDAKHNFGSDTLNLYLTNATPVATNTVYGTPADLSTGNGYTAGGSALTTTYTLATATATLATSSSPSWTASGGSIGPFRYVVLYNNTSSTKPLISWWDYGSSITLASGESFSVTVTNILSQT